MSFKHSEIVARKNADKWTQNLKNSENKCKNIPSIDISLCELNQIPKKKTVIGRFNALYEKEKLKTERYKIISQELFDLWTKLNIPKLATKSIRRKVECLIRAYQKGIKTSKTAEKFDNNFNISFENIAPKSEISVQDSDI